MEALAYTYSCAAYEEAAGIEYEFPEWELNWKLPSSGWIGLLAFVTALSMLSTTSGAFAISAGRYYVGSSSGVNVRSSPGGSVIYTRGYGKAVDLTGRTSGPWAQTVPGNWVHSSLLTGGGSYPGGNTGGRYVLGRGSKGSAVSDVQARLRDIGYSVGPAGVDGNYGSYTQSAVLRFQSRNGLLADGRVGGQTRAALFGTGRIMNPL